MAKDDARKQPYPTLDPFTRVRFSEGLLLGKAEFEQEQGYFRERGHLHGQAFHGYGTVSGLRVHTEESRVFVHPGLAVDPLGRLLHVDTEQVSDLNQWLENNRSAFRVESSDVRSLYVTLSYGETERDLVFIPATADRPQERTAYSRIAERAILRFAPEPVPDPAAEIRRRLYALLGYIRIADDVAGITPSEMEARVRSLLQGPPASDPLFVHPGETLSVFRAAFRVWSTEVEPNLDPRTTPDLLLARIDFILRPDGKAEDLTVVDTDRPILLPTSLLQESLLPALAGGAPLTASVLFPHQAGEAAGDLAGLFPAPRVTGIQGRPVSPDAPEEGTVLTWSGERRQWESRSLPAQPQAAAKPVVPFVTMAKLPGSDRCTLDLWFHLPSDITAMHSPFDLDVFAQPLNGVTAGDESQTGFEVPVLALEPRGPNRMELQLNAVANEHPHLRFEFRIKNKKHPDGHLLADILEQSGLTWLGYDGHSRIITYFRQPEQAPISEVVAAGIVEKGQVVRGHNLRVKVLEPGFYLLSFPGYRKDGFYVVKGAPLVNQLDYQRSFEVIREQHEDGIQVRATGADTGFTVEISRFL